MKQSVYTLPKPVKKCIINAEHNVKGMGWVDYTHYDLGDVKRGQYVEISLSGNAANIRLMDRSNFTGYKKNGQYRYIGGLANQSPVRLQIPRDGEWHVVIDMHGLKGKVKTSYKLLPALGKVKHISEAEEHEEMPLTYNKQELALKDESAVCHDEEEVEFVPKYDVFITFAGTETYKLVLPIVEALEAKGLKVWHEGFEIDLGDSLRRRVDKGLGNSRFGIIILSKGLADTKEDYNKREEIILKSLTGEQLILLVWHDITVKDLIRYNQSLVDKPVLNTAEHTPEEIACEVVRILKKNELFY